jgi:four helix bundle protein
VGEIRSYRDLKVWQDGMTLAEGCYRLTGEFPREELYGLTSQLRRAAVSIPANIAEGYGRNTTKAYVSFLRIAQGSLKELETHLLLSKRLGFAAGDKVQPLLALSDAIGRMLLSLARSVSDGGGRKAARSEMEEGADA